MSGGSGGSLAGLARSSGADVLLTADLKHHPVVEEVSERADGIALVDAAHWATEAPWLDDVAVRLRNHFGTSVDVLVSRRVTDPWTLHEMSIRGREHVNADPALQLRLLDLQAADTALAQLAHRRMTLPELAALAERGERTSRLADDITDAETRVGDLAGEQRRLENEVDAVRSPCCPG